MNIQSLGSRAFALAAGIVMLAVSSLASADPPSHVIRLGHMTGAVSFSPAGEDDWVQATMNRPMTIGDRLWVDSGARAELQIGGAVLRLNAGTSVTVLNLDDNISQLQLTQGTMHVRVRRFDPNQMLEIDTPNLAFTVRQAGEYRIAVDTEGNATDLIVRKGRGEVYGEGASYVVDSRQPYRFTGTGLREYEPFAAPLVDDFDRWAMDRDRVYDTSISARYVSPDVIGYQDLDTNGTWSADATYGNVWYPTRVAADWAPYRDGHWAWVDPWGWTWVDDAPWGFAVSHYGRWSNVRGRWGWVPGPVRQRAYYAPALVAFVGGNNFQLSISTGNVGGVAWFPLGPREVYRPAYPVSRRYFERVNVTNTVVNTTVINNYYNNTNVSNVTYVNRQVPGAVVAVPTTAFVQSQSVQRAAVRVTPQMAASAPVSQVVAVAPTEKSVRGAAAQRDKPPARVFERPVVARTAPAPAQASFASQQQQLQTRQGKPLDDAARKQIQAAPAAPAPSVKVVAQPKAAPATTPLPAGLATKDARIRSAPPATAGAPSSPAQGTAQGTAPAQVAQPGAAPQPPERERGKGQQRGRQPDAPATAATPPPAAQPQAASPPAPAQPQASTRPPMTPAEQAQTAEQRGKDQQRGKDKDVQPARAPEAASSTPQRMGATLPQPRVGSPSETTMPPQSQRSAQPRTEPPAQKPQEQARQAEQQKAREAQAAQQQARQAAQQAQQAEQQKAREAQAAQQQARQAAQQAQQAEQQKAREAQAAQQQARQAAQQAQQAEQQKARQAQAAQQQAQQAEQQKARQAQAAQQQAQQAEQQKARQAQAVQQQAQQAEQQKARQAQAAQQQAARQAPPVAAATPPQAQQRAPRPEQESKGKGNNKKDKDEEQKREEEARKQRG